ncbi:MAG: TIGR03087 family PEP-CTERM/XrtA system glycosyltransferase [Phycisphaerae bacterium]|nr:TIGR03087 family PEP-CTERM/XrtA system glycosyltransferase [Phycisphaerae bacterium]
MKILYIAHRIPYPPNKGDKLRSFNQIKVLSERHEIWCAAFADDPRDQVYAALLRRWCRDVYVLPLNRTWAAVRGLFALLGGGTVTQAFYRDKRMTRKLAHWVDTVQFDVVLVFSSGVADYALPLTTRVKILDFCDLDSRKWLSFAEQKGFPRSLLCRVEGRRLGLCERDWLERFDHAILISAVEKADLAEADDDDRVTVVGNGVLLPSAHHLPLSESKIVGFVGAMDYTPNVDAVTWFADRIWPAVLAEHPGARFQIVGRRPTAAVRRLARRRGVEVVGEVVHVIESLRTWQVSVAPMRLGRGVQNKVLEAMAAARPVVLTPMAAAGLSERDTRHLVIAGTADDFATSVNLLLGDVERCRRRGRALRQIVAREHNWAREVAKLETLFTQEPYQLKMENGKWEMENGK